MLTTDLCLRVMLISNWQSFSWTGLKALSLELTVAV